MLAKAFRDPIDEEGNERSKITGLRLGLVDYFALRLIDGEQHTALNRPHQIVFAVKPVVDRPDRNFAGLANLQKREVIAAALSQ
jgi:hypothetical protein